MKINVIPLHDLRGHEEHEGCACCPCVEQHGDDLLIIHNAWDQREVLELLATPIEQLDAQVGHA